MKRQGNKLSALQVARMKKPGRWGDGHGLWLQIGPSGSKSWCFCYKRQGRQHVMGLGPLYAVSLADARLKAKQANQCLADGGDPIALKKATADAERIKALRTITFEGAVGRFMAESENIAKLTNDKHRKQWRSTLELAFPKLGKLPLQAIDSALVLDVLLPIASKTPETGSRLRSRIAAVFDWAKPLKLFTGDNPAALKPLKAHIPTKPKQKHHAAMPYGELPAFMERLRGKDSMSARALEFTILTAARTGEVIGMKAGEVDFAAKVWTVPAARMKAKVEHKVPLSDRAVEILRGLNGSKSEPLFPLSNMAMLQMVRGMAGNGYTTHGFRSAFRDWCGERTNFPKDICEFALAHKLPNKVEASYRRETAVEKRRKLMEAWSKYLEAPAADGATVVSIRSA